MTSPFEGIPECICDHCRCALALDETQTGFDGETLCDDCAMLAQDELDGTADSGFPDSAYED